MLVIAIERPKLPAKPCYGMGNGPMCCCMLDASVDHPGGGTRLYRPPLLVVRTSLSFCITSGWQGKLVLSLPCTQLKLGDFKCSLLKCLLNVCKLLLTLLQLALTFSFLACRSKRAVKQQHDDDQTQQEDYCEDQTGQENSKIFLDTAPAEEVQSVKLAKLCLHKVVPLVSTNVECSQSLVTQCEGIEIWS